MKEKPSWPMRDWEVRAILEDRKTMTRRVIKFNLSGRVQLGKKQWHIEDPNCINACPYQIGQKLWVRESWRVGAWAEDQRIAVDYKADNFSRRQWLDVPDEELFERLYIQSTDDSIKKYGHQERYSWEPGESPCRWRPSIFMPRWVSRIDLEVTNIKKVERLQDISEEDAIREGSQLPCSLLPKSCQQGVMTERQQFSRIWDSINGKKYPWNSNYWVWVISFKRI